MPTIARQDATLYYETHGSGHPLVFIHGGGGNTLAFYQQVMHFRDRYRVITMDLRGFHRSVLAPGVVSHPADFPDDLLAVLDAEGIASAALVCQSLGAWAGLPLAVRHPERVSCLFINGSPTPAYSEKTGARCAAPPASSTRPAPNATRPWAGTARLPGTPGADVPVRPDQAAEPRLRLHADDGRARPAASRDFAGYAVPTLVAGGSHDDFLNGKAICTSPR